MPSQLATGLFLCLFACLVCCLLGLGCLCLSLCLSVLSGLSIAGRLIGVGSLGFRSLVGFVFCS